MAFKDKLFRFMYGRNGVDALGRFCFSVYIVLWVVNLFAQSTVLSSLSAVLAIYFVFRCLSKNVSARRAENMKYWNLKTRFDGTGVGAFFKKYTLRLAKLPTNRYRTCPHCKAELCLPRRRGKHTVRCPRCQKEFPVRILF